MQNLSLNDLLRYGFAGAVFFAVALVSFVKPQMLLLSDRNAALFSAGAAALALTIGCVVYALHRALTFPLFALLVTRLAKRGSLLDVDIQRWKNSQLPNSLQPKLSEWAAQIHLLYCIAWSAAAALGLGTVACWPTTPLHHLTGWLTLVFFLAAGVHHVRYQFWERRIFDVDCPTERNDG